jgi:hypothetical protein
MVNARKAATQAASQMSRIVIADSFPSPDRLMITLKTVGFTEKFVALPWIQETEIALDWTGGLRHSPPFGCLGKFAFR